jgi:hypothetical protein
LRRCSCSTPATWARASIATILVPPTKGRHATIVEEVLSFDLF